MTVKEDFDSDSDWDDSDAPIKEEAIKEEATKEEAIKEEPKKEEAIKEEPKMNKEEPIEAKHTFDGVIIGEEEENSNQNSDHQKARIYGAGAAGTVVGVLFGGGIVLGSLVGIATAYSATRDDAAGDVARAMGDVALTARDKARELDKEHHLLKKSKVAANDALEKVKEIDTAQVMAKSKVVASDVWEKAKEVDQKHDVVGKAKDLTAETAQRVAEFDRKHNIVAWTSETIEKVVTFLADKWKSKGGTSSTDRKKDHLAPVVLD